MQRTHSSDPVPSDPSAKITWLFLLALGHFGLLPTNVLRPIKKKTVQNFRRFTLSQPPSQTGNIRKKQIQTWDKNIVESSFLGLNHLQHIFNYVATVSKAISNTRLKGAVLFAKLHRFHPAPPVPNDLPLPLQAAPAARSANRQKSPRTLSPTAPWLWWSWVNYKQD